MYVQEKPENDKPMKGDSGNCKICGCPRKGFVCSCNTCKCDHCDDPKHIPKIKQQPSTKPDKKLYFDNRVISTNMFTCTCKDCGCHYCDDPDYQDKLEQAPSPPADEEKEFYNLTMDVCPANCAKPKIKDPCRAMKICTIHGRECN